MTALSPQSSIEVFFSYAHEDEALRDQLAKHLKLLEKQGIIQQWHDRQILPGSEWKGQIDSHLKSAQIILLLVSSDFLASDYCHDVEMTRALERHEAKEAIVIPVILREVDWQSAPFGKLTALPTDGKAITSWTNQDEAFTNVAKGIRKAVEQLQQGIPSPSPNPEPAIVAPSSSPPAPSPTMSQTNRENSTGYQFNVSGGTININHPTQP